MVQHLADQIKKNQEDATKNEIPEILMRFFPHPHSTVQTSTQKLENTSVN